MELLERYKELAAKLVSFKTVSTDPEFAGEIKRCVEWLANLFRKQGFTVETWQGKSTNPVLFAAIKVDPQYETVLVYGHYDVQPASIDGWSSDPWQLSERDGRLYGRGVIDNKGQFAIHMAAVFELLSHGELESNVMFLLEGNEETANEDLSRIIAEHKNQLRADTILISDGEIHGDQPAIEASLRGGMNIALTLKTATTALHSGIYGGVVPNAAHELVILLSRLFDNRGSFLVPEFYDDVDELTQAQRGQVDRSQHDAIKQMTGVKRLLVNKDLDAHIQAGLMPTVEITGLESGYTGQGFANIIPYQARVKLNFRLVASQQPKQILERFTRFIKEQIPDYVDFDLEVTGIHPPVKVSLEGQKVKRAQLILSKVYGQEVAVRYVGGGIPVVADFQEQLGVESLLIPLVNEDCNMHGANENFRLDLVERGLEFSQNFFKK